MAFLVQIVGHPNFLQLGLKLHIQLGAIVIILSEHFQTLINSPGTFQRFVQHLLNGETATEYAHKTFFIVVFFLHNFH
jgi:hypothetical protein